ncbi:MAG: 16S rRNA (cytidine(1402)-2'-O)-methyltransferase, partial [Desulfobacterota bacterium]|nr:16S rRNA (cytidine(1402)-2'-O)-methyltransferase [Thermodesulfobacteriota bacterium]
SLPDTLIFYESPHRLGKTLHNIYEVFGNRSAVLARELTKIHEEFIRADLSRLIDQVEQFGGKGEYTILVEGSENPSLVRQNSTNESLEDLLKALPGKSGSLKTELKKIAKKTGQSPKEIYRQYVQIKNSCAENDD